MRQHQREHQPPARASLLPFSEIVCGSKSTRAEGILRMGPLERTNDHLKKNPSRTVIRNRETLVETWNASTTAKWNSGWTPTQSISSISTRLANTSRIHRRPCVFESSGLSTICRARRWVATGSKGGSDLSMRNPLIADRLETIPQVTIPPNLDSLRHCWLLLRRTGGRSQFLLTTFEDLKASKRLRSTCQSE
jgi:hypothetical protein